MSTVINLEDVQAPVSNDVLLAAQRSVAWHLEQLCMRLVDHEFQDQFLVEPGMSVPGMRTAIEIVIVPALRRNQTIEKRGIIPDDFQSAAGGEQTIQ